MADSVRPVPEGYHTATPYLICSGGAEAIDFYKRAFGAVELMRMPMPNGRLGHAELKIGDSVIMLADENPESGIRNPFTSALRRYARQRVALCGERRCGV